MSATIDIDTGHSRSVGDLWAGLGKVVGLGSVAATVRDERPPAK